MTQDTVPFQLDRDVPLSDQFDEYLFLQRLITTRAKNVLLEYFNVWKEVFGGPLRRDHPDARYVSFTHADEYRLNYDGMDYDDGSTEYHSMTLPLSLMFLSREELTKRLRKELAEELKEKEAQEAEAKARHTRMLDELERNRFLELKKKFEPEAKQ